MKFKNVMLWCTVLGATLFVSSCNDDDNNVNIPEPEKIKVLADDEPEAAVDAEGFFVANEDWFGHDNGTVNYFKKNGDSYEAVYRAYRAANEGEQFGVTTQFATIWGENAYFVSKQGNRLVVTDAKTLKKKAAIGELGADGRSFTGIDDQKGYVGTNDGIVVFDIAKLELGSKIESVSGQIGSMCSIEGKVFAVSQRNGLYIIDTETDKLVKTIEGTFYTLTCSKDGNVWIAGSDKLICLNPLTLETTEIDYPDGKKVGSSWGAWNAGSLCASTQQNVLYWTSGGGMFGGNKEIVQYNIDTHTANTAFYTLGTSDAGTQLVFYGAGLRVDPLTDDLILTVCHSGYGASYAYNWIYKLDNKGREIMHFEVKGDNGTGASWSGNPDEWNDKYFWFPAIPFFEDANKPQILINQILLTPGETLDIDLNEKIVDYDNSLASIQKSVEFAENNVVEENKLEGSKLTIKAGKTTGKTTCHISVISNGVRVTKEIPVIVEEESNIER